MTGIPREAYQREIASKGGMAALTAVSLERLVKQAVDCDEAVLMSRMYSSVVGGDEEEAESRHGDTAASEASTISELRRSAAQLANSLKHSDKYDLSEDDRNRATRELTKLNTRIAAQKSRDWDEQHAGHNEHVKSSTGDSTQPVDDEGVDQKVVADDGD
eukprot:3864432-Amphidinium_carterae.2